MKTQKTYTDGADLAVRARGNGFYYAIRRFVGDAVEARRRHNAIRHTAEELALLPDYLKQDINWPAITNHEVR
ncbi:hypothetical protein [Sinorhizobium sp. RAC02]|uniref:hypothetical protein n=1 Tax=Sinorhizobium sp. RAC02 TaxID=1842534 RepID=UPI00083CD681|nr:hypothetical protein [Sinorhizobium sp. RAC02]AOF91262.1 hypothetical protein BSY16_749 [Sinorhizobium sp. RAC02]